MILTARLIAAVAVLISASTVTAHADSYSYSFTDTTDAPSLSSFTYISPVLITTTTTFVALTCVLENHGCSDVKFLFGADSFVSPASLEIDSPHETNVIDFNSAADLTTLGTTTTFDGHVILTITDLSASSVPEPSTLALFSTGILGLAGTARRRFLRA
jgi:hypothetical protein